MTECRKSKDCCLTCTNWSTFVMNRDSIGASLTRKTYGGWDTPEMVETNADEVLCSIGGQLLGGSKHSPLDKCMVYSRDQSL